MNYSHLVLNGGKLLRRLGSGLISDLGWTARRNFCDMSGLTLMLNCEYDRQFQKKEFSFCNEVRLLCNNHGVSSPITYDIGRKYHSKLIKAGLTSSEICMNTMLTVYAHFDQNDCITMIKQVGHDASLDLDTQFGLQEMGLGHLATQFDLAHIGDKERKIAQAHSILAYTIKIGYQRCVLKCLKKLYADMEMYKELGNLLDYMERGNPSSTEDLKSISRYSFQNSRRAFQRRTLELRKYGELVAEARQHEQEITVFCSTIRCLGRNEPHNFEEGLLMHSCSIKTGFYSDIECMNSLLDFYGTFEQTSDCMTLIREIGHSASLNFGPYGSTDHYGRQKNLFVAHSILACTIKIGYASTVFEWLIDLYEEMELSKELRSLVIYMEDIIKEGQDVERLSAILEKYARNANAASKV